jgi:hypothetical protein
MPLPRDLVERWYSTGAYLSFQPAVTGASNAVPVALLDLLAAAGILLLILIWRRRLRSAGGLRLRGAARAAADTGVLLAVVYLWFFLAWGLNYQRVPLTAKLAFARSQVTEEALARLASRTVEQLDSLHGPAHQALATSSAWGRPPLERAFADVQRLLLAHQAPRLAAPGRPKLSLLSLYFGRSGVDAMTNPLFLEVIVNQDLLPPERPFTLAHEWAHLAGYANEAEANFVGLLMCLRADDAARYSAWLALYFHVANALPEERRAGLLPLGEGPRADVRAIVARLERSSPAIRRAAARAYDRFLRANRVPGGIASYGAVLTLVLGTDLLSEGP